MKRIGLREAWNGTADCRACCIRQSVLFAGLNEPDFEKFHRPIEQTVFAPGSTIYTNGERAHFLFTIRTGLVKLIQYLPDGTQRIVRLPRSTDLIGLEALIEPEYQHTAIVLQETQLCRLPVEFVRHLSQTNLQLYQALMTRWHKALSSAERWITELSTGSARERVVRLLLWLSEHVEHAENEGCDLFSREDLGAMLGLTTETASRTMAELKRRGVITEPRLNHFQCDVAGLHRLLEA